MTRINDIKICNSFNATCLTVEFTDAKTARCHYKSKQQTRRQEVDRVMIESKSTTSSTAIVSTAPFDRM